MKGPFAEFIIQQGYTDKALPLVYKSYKDLWEKGQFYYAAKAALSIGDIYLKKDPYHSALYWCNLGLDHAGKVFNQLKSEESDTSQQIVYSGYQSVLNIARLKSGSAITI